MLFDADVVPFLARETSSNVLLTQSQDGPGLSCTFPAAGIRSGVVGFYKNAWFLYMGNSI